MIPKIELFHLVIRIPKEHSSFLYFQLEACEGLGFYSTIDHKEGDSFRDIDIKGDLRLKYEVLELIDGLKEKTQLKILTDERILDQ